MLKRTLILCVFFMLIACTQPETETEIVVEAPPPLLSLNELLAAQDVQQILATAAMNKDQNALQDLQSVLLSAAQEVHLAESEVKLISGSQGLIFLEYQGMRINFQQEFEDAFFNFGDLEAIYARYPAFVQLQDKTRTLVENRDNLVSAIERDLIENGVSENTTQQARTIWMQMMQDQGLDSLSL